MRRVGVREYIQHAYDPFYERKNAHISKVY